MDSSTMRSPTVLHAPCDASLDLGGTKVGIVALNLRSNLLLDE